jgi:hypothetical protein
MFKPRSDRRTLSANKQKQQIFQLKTQASTPKHKKKSIITDRTNRKDQNSRHTIAEFGQLIPAVGRKDKVHSKKSAVVVEFQLGWTRVREYFKMNFFMDLPSGFEGISDSDIVELSSKIVIKHEIDSTPLQARIDILNYFNKYVIDNHQQKPPSGEVLEFWFVVVLSLVKAKEYQELEGWMRSPSQEQGKLFPTYTELDFPSNEPDEWPPLEKTAANTPYVDFYSKFSIPDQPVSSEFWDNPPRRTEILGEAVQENYLFPPANRTDQLSMMEIGIKHPNIYNISDIDILELIEFSKNLSLDDIVERLQTLNWMREGEKKRVIDFVMAQKLGGVRRKRSRKKLKSKRKSRLKSKRKSRGRKIKLITKKKRLQKVKTQAKKKSQILKPHTKIKKYGGKNPMEFKLEKTDYKHNPIGPGSSVGKKLPFMAKLVSRAFNQLLVALNLVEKQWVDSVPPILVNIDSKEELREISDQIKDVPFVCLIVYPYTPNTEIEREQVNQITKGRNDVKVGKLYIIKNPDPYLEWAGLRGAKKYIRAKWVRTDMGKPGTPGYRSNILYESSSVEYGLERSIGFGDEIEQPLGGPGELNQAGIIIGLPGDYMPSCRQGSIYMIRPFRGEEKWSIYDKFLEKDTYGFTQQYPGGPKAYSKSHKEFLGYCRYYSLTWDNFANGWMRDKENYFRRADITGYVKKQYESLPLSETGWSWAGIPLEEKFKIIQAKTEKIIEGLKQGFACKSDFVLAENVKSQRYYRGINGGWMYPFDGKQPGMLNEARWDTVRKLTMEKPYLEKGLFSVSIDPMVAAGFTKGNGYVCIIWKVGAETPYIAMDREKTVFPFEKEVIFQSPNLLLIWDPYNMYELQGGGFFSTEYTEGDKQQMKNLIQSLAYIITKKVIFIELQYETVAQSDHNTKRKILPCKETIKLSGTIVGSANL